MNRLLLPGMKQQQTAKTKTTNLGDQKKKKKRHMKSLEGNLANDSRLNKSFEKQPHLLVNLESQVNARGMMNQSC